MIPTFPAFGHIEPEGLGAIRNITSKFPDYSDYNCASLFAWDINQDTLVSSLYGNLVVVFSDYITNDRQVGFMGTNRVNQCMDVLKDFLSSMGLAPKIRYVPYETVSGLHRTCQVEEDRDNHDYVLDLNKIASPKGKKLRNFRRKIEKFSNLELRSEFHEIDLTDNACTEDLVDTFMRRESSKDSDYENELRAMNRLIGGSEFFRLQSYGLSIEGKCEAFIILETPGSDMAVGHFWKANTDIPGIYSQLLKLTSETLIAEGYEFMNIEQDLGIPGLRRSKELLRPSFLKKYSVTPA